MNVTMMWGAAAVSALVFGACIVGVPALLDSSNGGSGGGGTAGSGGSGGDGGSGGGGDGGARPLTYPEIVMCDRPVAYFRFDEDPEQGGVPTSEPEPVSGDAIFVGVVDAGAMPPTRIPSAKLEDGAWRLYGTTKITFASLGNFVNENSFTIEVVVKATDVEEAPRVVAGRFGADNGYKLSQFTNEMEFRRSRKVGAGGTEFDQVGDEGNLDTQPHLWIASYSNTQDGFCLWRDAIDDLVCETGDTVIAPLSVEFSVSPEVGTSQFKGDIDELAIYETALTTAQGLAHSNALEGVGQSFTSCMKYEEHLAAQ